MAFQSYISSFSKNLKKVLLFWSWFVVFFPSHLLSKRIFGVVNFLIFWSAVVFTAPAARKERAFLDLDVDMFVVFVVLLLLCQTCCLGSSTYGKNNPQRPPKWPESVQKRRICKVADHFPLEVLEAWYFDRT